MHSPARSDWSRRRMLSLGLGTAAGLALGAASSPARARAPLFSPQPQVPPVRQGEPGHAAEGGRDPGHTRADVGASGAGVGEFEHTLDVAFRLIPLLEAAGLRVALTRTDHEPLSAMAHRDVNERTRIEQAARIASVGNVRIYVSIHFNGGGTPALRGTETYYNADNAGPDSPRLAEAIQRHMLASLEAVGHAVVDRRAKSDLTIGKPYGHLFSLRGGMPSALGEPLFLSNP